MQTPAYKKALPRAVCRAEKTGRWSDARGLDVKRVVHAVAVVTTTHPVVVRHVKNNMAPTLLPSHWSIAVHELHARRLVGRKTSHGTKAGIVPG
jgi:hypothetical protein